MAVKKTKRKYIKTIHPNKTVLGLFKDIDTNSFMAFDESGNVEEVTSTPSLTITDIQAPSVSDIASSIVSIDSSITSAFTTSNIEANGKVGYIEINLNDNLFGSGATLEIPITNSFVTENSIILLTLENLQTTGSASNNKSITINVKDKALESFTITLCTVWAINTGTDYYQESSFKVNFLIL